MVPLALKKLEKYLLQIITVGISILFFLPLLVNEHFLFPFVFPRTIVFRLIIESCLVLYLMVCLRNQYYRPRRSVLLALLAGFVGVMAVTSLFGADPYHSFWSSVERSEGIVTWLHLLAFFIILVGVYKTWDDWLPVFRMVIIAGCVQTVYA